MSVLDIRTCNKCRQKFHKSEVELGRCKPCLAATYENRKKVIPVGKYREVTLEKSKICQVCRGSLRKGETAVPYGGTNSFSEPVTNYAHPACCRVE